MAIESIFHNITIDDKKSETFITTLKQVAKNSRQFSSPPC